MSGYSGSMWHTLTLQRPHRAKQGDKARSQQQQQQQQEDRARLRRAKTFCDNLADEADMHAVMDDVWNVVYNILRTTTTLSL